MTYKNCITVIGLSIIVTLGMSSFLFPSSESSAPSITDPQLSLIHIIDLALKNNSQFNTLNIDYKQQGVGGDIPALAMLHKKYKLKGDEDYSYTFRITGYSKDKGNFNSLFKKVPPLA